MYLTLGSEGPQSDGSEDFSLQEYNAVYFIES
jgi:hypothetical protein